ncbi:naringenin-chalcone synthase [Halobacillus locisalis]|uniref:Naringenin-chalcone synthase n=1 Tax=Halobacillus locisalis TaxID=220753 RepID=A0A838CPN0_9BACI|nr:3-oxoacyl-[acyl-carrier-protein] synthase III C-terminal domain-containing protein [Halobacillus locisalis]MBA2173924.1 naringenin-chalcone synthase [Halobacillus locisalis]
MPYILSSGIKEAEFYFDQQTVQELVYELFPLKDHEKKRLMPIFENAQINQRQFAASLDWFKLPHGMRDRNELYMEKSIQYAKDAIKSCMHSDLLRSSIAPEKIDHIIFVSSTGIATPTIDTYLINELGFKDSVRRSPLFGLGCAGGTSGVARAYEWLKGHPDKNVLVVCVELCSLTFQATDRRIANFVGTALFGDGASAVLLAGDESELLEQSSSLVQLGEGSSRIKRDSIDVMGWRVVDHGFEVIFNKSIPRLVREFWGQHMKDTLEERQWAAQDLAFIVAHPGGRKVLEAYQELFHLPDRSLTYSRDVLARHGNMSSPTVHFVLHAAMMDRPKSGTKSMMTSLGPGFSSEMISMEWV